MTEKEIIKQIKDLIRDRESFIKGNLEGNEDSEFVKDKKALEGILDLYNKQQKEIEELKEKRSIISVGRRQYGKTYGIVKDYISKDKIREKIKNFKAVKQEIFSLENKLGIPSITYDIVRNDYCEKMLEDLLKE